MVRRLAILVACVLAFVSGSLGSTRAQEQRSPSILEFFGIKPDRPKVIVKKPSAKGSPKKAIKKKVPGRKKTAAKSSAGNAGRAAGGVLPGKGTADASAVLPAIPEKLLEAKTILVVGDFMAEGVAEGMEVAFEAEAGVKIVARANGSSGFIRDDFYNWPLSIATIVAEVKPQAIAVLIGTNDRQPLRMNGNKEAVRSTAWIAEYEKRVASFATALKATGVPVVWIGLPPFKQNNMSADMLALNDIYRKNSEAISGRFVDVWEGFLDEQGAFSINGFDYNGQPARLRASDGINLTFAGKRKIAFFAEKPLREALGALAGAGGTGEFNAFDPFGLPGPKKPNAPALAQITRLAPVSLFDPAFDGDGELLGKPSTGERDASSALSAKALYVDGIAPPAVRGRVDENARGFSSSGQ